MGRSSCSAKDHFSGSFCLPVLIYSLCVGQKKVKGLVGTGWQVDTVIDSMTATVLAKDIGHNDHACLQPCSNKRPVLVCGMLCSMCVCCKSAACR